ncbi:MAG: hypothetical protein U0798_07765 [Gemmataceae bacterium]
MSHSPDPVDNQTIDHTESAPIAEPVKTQVNSQIPSPAFAETVGYDPSNAVPTQRIEPDAIIADRYQLLTEIARGGMGVVYSARDSKLNREVAVKFLLERISLQSQSARRFFEEAQIAAQLQHPGIAPVHDMGILVDGRPF